VAKVRAASTDQAEKDPLVLQESVTSLNETQLISRSLGGDTLAYSAIVEFYQARAIRTAYALVGHWEDARDLAQEAFIKAYNNLKDFKAESRFYTWFYRILFNTCGDFLRKKKIRGFISLWVPRHAEEENENSSPLDQAADTGPTAFKELENKELGGQIFAAIQRLPFQQRSVFSLRYLEGSTLEEISRQMNLSLGAVKAHLWQAGQKVRKILTEGGLTP